jgi:NADPH:quinone reductase-like Zn-dependent oxidoreductase
MLHGLNVLLLPGHSLNSCYPDFVSMKPGDVIIQNAANSAVGLAIIELSRHFGLKTINIIRKRCAVSVHLKR